MDFNKQVIALAKKLVEFPSISPNSSGCIEYIQDYLQKIGFQVQRLDRNATANLFVTYGEGNKSLVFAGHIDVVPPGEGWKHDPFELIEEDDKLIGRGIADMKGAVAAFLVAVTKFVQNFDSKQYKVGLILTSDEEAAATDGTIVVVDYLKSQQKKFDYCILGEPSSVKYLGDVIKVGRRGSLTGYLEVFGKQGHAAYPHLCQNPIHLFAPVLAEFSQITWDIGNEYFPATALQFVNINSGLGVTNVIPGELQVNFNFRYNNLYTAEELKDKVETILDKYKLKYTIDWKHSAKPFLTKIGDLHKIISNCIIDNLKIEPKSLTDGGTSDGRFLIDICDEIIELGLTNATIHQVNETVPTKDLSQLTKLYYTILTKLFIV